MDRVTLGKKIQLMRKKAGLTQEDLAEAADVAPRVIQRIESGQANPKIGTLIAIAEALGTTTDVLLAPAVRAAANVLPIPSLKFQADLLAAIEALPPVRKQFVLALIFGDEKYIQLPAIRRLFQASSKSV